LEAKQINTTALAYLGDAVYEVEVRRRMMIIGTENVDQLHQMSVKFVRAEGQAYAIKQLLNDLTDAELAIVKRARNRKIVSKPKNLDPVIYKLATALEALIGYLYLNKEDERLDAVITKSIEIIGERVEKNERKTETKYT
jgi:ribonuclease-3 family protein